MFSLAIVNPADRIALITESARLLAAREWTDLDLILRQHNLRTSDDAPAGPYAYVISMVEDAKDADLVALHSYLVGDNADAPSEAQPWEQGHLRLFMSHLATHQEFVGNVSYLLSFEGVSGFVAHTSIDPSREWQSVIETALRSCDAMVILLHKGFHESMWCDQEVGFALARRIPVLPVAIDRMPYGFMSKFQALKAGGLQAGQLAPQLTNWLTSTPTAQAAMTEGLVNAFGRSGSYDSTRRLLKLLQRMPRFTPEQLDKLDSATKSNDQVRDANLSGVMVPEIIQKLIVQHGGTTARSSTSFFSDEPPF